MYFIVSVVFFLFGKNRLRLRKNTEVCGKSVFNKIDFSLSLYLKELETLSVLTNTFNSNFLDVMQFSNYVDLYIDN